MNIGIGISLANYRPVPTVPLDPDAAIAELFRTGTPGVYYEGAWYDPSDSSTVWQDAAGTTPAGVGDPVGRIDDKSGNGNHATQTTSAARPVLQQSGGLYYLDFDGVDDYLSAGDVNGLDGLNAATFGFGAVSTSSTVQRVVTAKWNGPFGFLIDSALILQRGFFGSSSVASAAKPGDDAAHVSTWEFDADAYLRVDGLSITLTNPSGPVIPTGSNSEHFLVGAKSDNGVVNRYFLGPIYSLVVIDRRITAGEITDLETYLAAKSGVTI